MDAFISAIRDETLYDDWTVRFVANELWYNDPDTSLLGWYQYGYEDYRTRVMRILLGSNDEEDLGRAIPLDECSELTLAYVRTIRPSDAHFHTDMIRFASNTMLRNVLRSDHETLRMAEFARVVEDVGRSVAELIELLVQDA
jgi:hypothetical protein